MLAINEENRPSIASLYDKLKSYLYGVKRLTRLAPPTIKESENVLKNVQ